MSWVEDVRSYPTPARRWLADELHAAIRDAVSGAGLGKGSIGVFDAEMPAGTPATSLSNVCSVHTTVP